MTLVHKSRVLSIRCSITIWYTLPYKNYYLYAWKKASLNINEFLSKLYITQFFFFVLLFSSTKLYFSAFVFNAKGL